MTVTPDHDPTSALPLDPLADLDPVSIDALFEKDPIDYTPEDLSAIVAHMREQRVLWQQAEASGKRMSSSKKTASAKPKAVPASGPVSLADLGDLI